MPVALAMTQVFLRSLIIVTTLVAAWLMLTSKQTVTLFNIKLDAKYSFVKEFVFLAYANIAACAFSVLALVFVFILCCQGLDPRNYFTLFLHDTLMMVVIVGGTGASTAMGLLGKNGNGHTGWMPMCDNFGNFCHRVGMSMVFSYLASILLLILTLSAYKSMQT